MLRPGALCLGDMNISATLKASETSSHRCARQAAYLCYVCVQRQKGQSTIKKDNLLKAILVISEEAISLTSIQRTSMHRDTQCSQPTRTLHTYETILNMSQKKGRRKKMFKLWLFVFISFTHTPFPNLSALNVHQGFFFNR